MLFLTETALRKWFSWKQGKVYPHNFYFEILAVDTGEKSQSFREISFVVLELTEEKPRGRVKNTSWTPYKVKTRFNKSLCFLVSVWGH